jgi:hypothetical protein
MSLQAFIKGMNLGEIDALIESIEVFGPSALPFALSVYNLNNVLDALREAKRKITQGETRFRSDQSAIEAAGGLAHLIRGGSGIGFRGSLGQSGGSVEIEAGEEEKSDDEPDFTGDNRVDDTGIRQRGNVDADPSDRGDLRDVDINQPSDETRIDIEEGEADNNDKERRGRRLPRPGRRKVGIGGVGLVSIIQIIRGLYPTATVKSLPDGNIEVTEPDGTTKIINPDDVKQMQGGTQGQMPAMGGGGGGGSQFNIKKKFKNPRRGRHNYIWQEVYTDRASKSTGAGAPNVITPSLKI